MINSTDDIWVKYIEHVIGSEAGLSNDSRDPAAACNPGLYHTNRGVTFCTFKAKAASLGITPVTYDRFLKLSTKDAAKFMYSYYTAVNGNKLPDTIALQVTEAAWGSGPGAANNLLIKSLNDIGVKVATTAQAYKLANTVDEKKLYDSITKRRYLWLDKLSNQPKYKIYKKGWLDRQKRFTNLFAPFASKKKISNGFINFDNFIRYLFNQGGF